MNDTALRHKSSWSLLVVAFLALQVTLAARSLLLEDARLGWGMFSYQTNYSVAYEWVLADGGARPQPAVDLAGRALKYVGDDAVHRTRYGLGGIRSWMRSYSRHMYDRYRPADALAFRAVVDYRINKRGASRRLTVEYPPAEEGPRP
jgi:hypothetical protein